MTRSFRVVAVPLVWLAVLLAVASVFAVTIQMKGGGISRGTATLYNASFGYLLALAVEHDRKALGRSAPFDYSAFMFFLWWVLFPVYLFQTRRWRGLGLALCVLLLSSLPDFVASGAYALFAH